MKNRFGGKLFLYASIIAFWVGTWFLFIADGNMNSLGGAFMQFKLFFTQEEIVGLLAKLSKQQLLDYSTLAYWDMIFSLGLTYILFYLFEDQIKKLKLSSYYTRYGYIAYAWGAMAVALGLITVQIVDAYPDNNSLITMASFVVVLKNLLFVAYFIAIAFLYYRSKKPSERDIQEVKEIKKEKAKENLSHLTKAERKYAIKQKNINKNKEVNNKE